MSTHRSRRLKLILHSLGIFAMLLCSLSHQVSSFSLQLITRTRPFTPSKSRASSSSSPSSPQSSPQSSPSNVLALLDTISLPTLNQMCHQFGILVTPSHTKLDLLHLLQSKAESSKTSSEEDAFFYDSSKLIPTSSTNAEITSKVPALDAEPDPDPNSSQIITSYDSTHRNDLTSSDSTPPLSELPSKATSGGGAATGSTTLNKSQSDATDRIFDYIGYLLTPKGITGPNDDEVSLSFNPNSVDVNQLKSFSKDMRYNKGSALEASIRKAELDAVGTDGDAGDDIRKGGGKYKEVSRVAAFLRGYRQAEALKIARVTCTVLLGNVFESGVEALDGVIGRIKLDGGLDDDLLDYLEEVIKQQSRKKVGVTGSERDSKRDIEEEVITTSVIDNNDSEIEMLPNPAGRPVDTVIAVLKMLHNRLKAEAIYGLSKNSDDETTVKGTNLRLLAYVLREPDANEKKSLLSKELFGSLSRAEAFEVLVGDSIEYCKSVQAELMPRKVGLKSLMDVDLLEEVMRLIGELRMAQKLK